MALSGTDLGKLLLTVSGISDMYDSEKEVDEADYREKASHLLDPVGVKASTASLKGQDTAMISVVETLLKKIDRLEQKVDETQKFDLSQRDNTIAHCIMSHISELTPQVLQNRQHAVEVIKSWLADAGIDTPASRKYLA